jgi:phytanoyl-CoA hydroxylase
MFKIYVNQISAELIDQLLKQHSNFKKSKLSIFRAQGTASFEAPIIDSYNNQVNSIHNPHLLGLNRSFSKQVELILTNENISKCLTDFTKSQKHVWYQSMFFDKSTGTKLHQDTWYLDTIPQGKLVGVWVALEDIKLSAGPFCIYTGTDDGKIFKTDEFDFDNLEKDQKFVESYPNFKRYDFTAKKGDVLIWDSLAIHGALIPEKDSDTRKSLTAHFYPLGHKIQLPPVSRFFSVYNHLNPIPTANPNIEKATTINPIVYQSICFAFKNMNFLKKLIMKEKSFKVNEVNTSEIRRLNK